LERYQIIFIPIDKKFFAPAQFRRDLVALEFAADSRTSRLNVRIMFGYHLDGHGKRFGDATGCNAMQQYKKWPAAGLLLVTDLSQLMSI
jgi:hypothetical protein